MSQAPPCYKKLYLETPIEERGGDFGNLEFVFGSECYGDDEGADVYFIKEEWRHKSPRVLVVIAPFVESVDEKPDVNKWEFLEFDSLKEAIKERLYLHQFHV